MIRVFYADRFIKSAQETLDASLQNKLADFIALIQHNPFHPRLHTKALSGPLAGIYSFRINRDWRVLFKFLSPDEIQLIDIGHRKDIYR